MSRPKEGHSLTAYYVKPTGADVNVNTDKLAPAEFISGVTRANGAYGRGDGKAGRTIERLFAYGSGYGERVPYSAIHGDIRTSTEADLKTPRLIAEYLNGGPAHGNLGRGTAINGQLSRLAVGEEFGTTIFSRRCRRRRPRIRLDRRCLLRQRRGTRLSQRSLEKRKWTRTLRSSEPSWKQRDSRKCRRTTGSIQRARRQPSCPVHRSRKDRRIRRRPRQLGTSLWRHPRPNRIPDPIGGGQRTGRTCSMRLASSCFRSLTTGCLQLCGFCRSCSASAARLLDHEICGVQPARRSALRSRRPAGAGATAPLTHPPGAGKRTRTD